MTEPNEATSGRRVTAGVAAAATASALLLVVAVVALVLGLRGSPSAPGAEGTPPAAPPSGSAPATVGATASDSPAPSVSPGQGGTRAAGRPGTSGAAPAGTLQGGPLAASEPTLLEIPSIGVRSRTFVPLGVQPDGTISVPGTAQEVGLYDGGPTPGQLGSSVIAAHVDTPSGVPGVFYRLGAVKAGDVIEVTRRDRSHLVFTVDKVAAYEKSRFPTDLVYRSDFRRAEIRLVTCGGPTDSRNEYRDNVIVFGHLTSAS
ncbi:hypothetical protein GCM10027039_38130 [Terrabacter koreensis]